MDSLQGVRQVVLLWAEAPYLHHTGRTRVAGRCSNGPTPFDKLACIIFVLVGVVAIVAVLGAVRLERFFRKAASGCAVVPELGICSLLRSVGTSRFTGTGWVGVLAWLFEAARRASAATSMGVFLSMSLSQGRSSNDTVC